MLIVSFPRSGQHLFERMCKHIFMYYKKEFSYCEFYNCCKKIPCVKKSVFQKNHDFNLHLQFKNYDKFIVLYRKDKIKQLESYYRYETYKKDVYGANIDYNNPNVFTKLINFIKQKITYYDGFINKYIVSDKYPNSLKIEYNDFIMNQSEYIARIIIYLDIKLNHDDLEKDVENIINSFEKIEYKNSIDDELHAKILANI